MTWKVRASDDHVVDKVCYFFDKFVQGFYAENREGEGGKAS
jgi:hypothetical protein